MDLDFSREGLRSLPVTADFGVLRQRLADVIDMSSPIGENISGTLLLGRSPRQVSISRLASQPHLYSVTLLSIDDDDSFERVKIKNSDVPELEKQLMNISDDFHLHSKAIVSDSLKLSVNLDNEEVVGLSWYHPNVEVG
ncbi:hypothetical protein [Corynebacterium auriscanis]|uniref:hypothetical protein n=1 Tax=Corynebacterium auriscanis TaxID=99807 RepID=UPI0012EC871E|nr:hypothetical protein [Corynebacterium auriscanis]MCX2164223.1 hypothetical protein [Corynebacterium auriscanis]WJY71756.1 hypothetical protein CAURIC_00360 [Corynebacterium auriscanis]